jgi:hypothetical protein
MDVPLSGKAATLRDIRRVCGLGPLSSPEDLDKYWVNTDAARTANFSLRSRICRTLEDEDEHDTRILVYGHGGCGKTTELSKLIEELGEAYFAVRFSIRNEMNLACVQAEDLLLVLTERLLQQAKDNRLSVSDSTLKPVHDYFAEVTHTTIQGRESSLAVSAEASAGTKFFGPLLTLLGGIKGEIKLNAHSTETVVAALRKRPADLLCHINLVVNAVRQAIPQGRRLLLVIEDLDKLDIASARRVFIENVNLLTGIVADIIYTIPIFTLHSPDAAILRNHFHAFGLAMIKTTEWNGARAPGFELVRDIIHSRVEPSAVEAEALDLLIEKTGGVLQHAFEVLRNAALLDSAAVPLTKAHVAEALKFKRAEFWSEITLPTAKVEGVEKLDQLYDRLEEHAKRQLKGEKNPPQVDAINQILLRSCALVEYNGDRWYGVHPLVIDNLRELGRIS